MHNYIIYDGVDSRSFGLYFEFNSISILPSSRECVQEIPLLDGVIDYNVGGYDRRIIRTTAIFPDLLSKMRAKRDKIEAWLANSGKPKKLILGNQPDRYYMAKITSALDFDLKSDRRLGEVEFVCNPPWGFLNNGALLTPETIKWVNADVIENQFVKEFTQSGSIRFVNNGNLPIKPTIKIIGVFQSGIQLVYKDKIFDLNYRCFNDGIMIDCQNESVVRMSDGSNLSPFIDNNFNSFFSIESGHAEIEINIHDVDNVNNDITVIVEFNAQVGVQNG